MKKDLVAFNNRPTSIYVHLDQLLFDLKYDPSIIEIPVPRYFKEDDNIRHELLKLFKEPPVRDAPKKKKKAKKKKKKKKGGDEEEKEEEPIRLDEKIGIMDSLLDKYKGTKDPEIEVTQDPFELEINFNHALRLI